MRPQGAKMRQGDSKIKNSGKLKEKAKLSTGDFVNIFAFPFKAEFGNRPIKGVPAGRGICLSVPKSSVPAAAGTPPFIKEE